MGQNICDGQGHGQPGGLDPHVSILGPEQDKHVPNNSFAKQVDEEPYLIFKVLQTLGKLGQLTYPAQVQVPVGIKLETYYKLKNGIVYYGQWKRGKMHGKGKYYLPDDSLIQCTTQQNQIKGYGRMVNANGDCYMGELNNSQANGNGVYFQGPVSFKGTFKDNLPHGEGLQEGPNFTFEGQFEAGKRLKGKLVWTDDKGKQQYDGHFSNDLFQGQGKMIDQNGRYEGTWANGLKDGQGKYTWLKSKAYYVGSFRDDMRHGSGTLYDKNGSTLQTGQWVDDQIF